MNRNTLQTLLVDHYEEIQYTLHPRSSVMENIDKMINFGDPAFGGAIYVKTHNQMVVGESAIADNHLFENDYRFESAVF